MNSVTHDYRLSDFVTPGKITSGLDAVVDRVAGTVKRRRSVLERLREDAERVDALTDSFGPLSNEALRDRLTEYRQWFRRQNGAEGERLFEALAAIREAAEMDLVEDRLRPQ